MGNSSSSPRYYGEKEASEIIDREWPRLKSQLSRLEGQPIHFNLFQQILLASFDKMPRHLCEGIFAAFSSDIDGEASIGDVVGAYAAIKSQDCVLLNRFIFAVYDSTHAGVVDRSHMEDVLVEAYNLQEVCRPVSLLIRQTLFLAKTISLPSVLVSLAQKA
jgi:hypothetical protein